MTHNQCQPDCASELLPCPFCGSQPVVEQTGFSGRARYIYCNRDDCLRPKAVGENEEAAIRSWNTRVDARLGVQNGDAKEALRLLGAEDERQTKLHEILETIREQIRLEVPVEHRPKGLFQNIQNAVYAMRGRTALLNDAAIVGALAGSVRALALPSTNSPSEVDK